MGSLFDDKIRLLHWAVVRVTLFDGVVGCALMKGLVQNLDVISCYSCPFVRFVNVFDRLVAFFCCCCIELLVVKCKEWEGWSVESWVKCAQVSSPGRKMKKEKQNKTKHNKKITEENQKAKRTEFNPIKSIHHNKLNSWCIIWCDKNNFSNRKTAIFNHINSSLTHFIGSYYVHPAASRSAVYHFAFTTAATTGL